jgi:hypothetical protein
VLSPFVGVPTTVIVPGAVFIVIFWLLGEIETPVILKAGTIVTVLVNIFEQLSLTLTTEVVNVVTLVKCIVIDFAPEHPPPVSGITICWPPPGTQFGLLVIVPFCEVQQYPAVPQLGPTYA